MYIGMLMSDWYTVSHVESNSPQVDTGLGALWVKITTSWIAFALYEWTMIGPVIFSDRDWSV